MVGCIVVFVLGVHVDFISVSCVLRWRHWKTYNCVLTGPSELSPPCH
jgi:hypothetical protein